MDVGSIGTGVTDGCELLCQCWESNQDPHKISQLSQLLSDLFSPAIDHKMTEMLKQMLVVLVTDLNPGSIPVARVLILYENCCNYRLSTSD